jgi:hypothetical protein
MKHHFPPDCPKTLQELIGRHVVTIREMSNASVCIPSGTVMKVDYCNRWDDLALTAPACTCCDIAPRIRGVSIRDVRMARDADLLSSLTPVDPVAAERERCAKIADARAASCRFGSPISSTSEDIWGAVAADEIAAAIRAPIES